MLYPVRCICMCSICCCKFMRYLQLTVSSTVCVSTAMSFAAVHSYTPALYLLMKGISRTSLSEPRLSSREKKKTLKYDDIKICYIKALKKDEGCPSLLIFPQKKKNCDWLVGMLILEQQSVTWLNHIMPICLIITEELKCFWFFSIVTSVLCLGTISHTVEHVDALLCKFKLHLPWNNDALMYL